MRCITCNETDKGVTILGIKRNYKVCSSCLKKYMPEVKIEAKGVSKVTRLRLETKARKRELQAEIDKKLNHYLLGV